MRIINIIVTHPDTGIVSVDSFGIVDEQMSDEVVYEAEDFMLDKCVELKFGTGTNETREDLRERSYYRDDISEELENGYINVGESTVSIVWSSIDNVQL